MVFSNVLIDWYLKNKRELPWRKSRNPYHIWLSEIMLQQTRIAQGLPYYLKFITAFPTVFDLANASEEQVLKLWQGLGYYSRARNLHTTANYVATNLNGVFPDSYKGLLKLKGIGDYTASAIASICYNEPVAVVDGNVYRVLARYFEIDTPINSGAGIKEFKALAIELLGNADPGNFNQAIMEFGALQCKPKQPLCISCPLSSSCLALKNNRIAQLPLKIKKLKVRTRYFNYLVFRTADDTTLLEQRLGKGIWEGLYQFPLIETSSPVNARQLSELDMFNEIAGIDEIRLSLYNEIPIIHKLSHQHIHAQFWIIEKEELAGDSIMVHKIKDYPVPVLIANFINEYSF